MATTLSIYKISGVLFVAEDALNPKSYFGAAGNYQFATDDTTVIITIGSYQVSVPYTGLRIGASAQAPTTVTTAKTLLNAIFAS